MTPPKLGFLMPNKVFSGQKKFLVAPKLKKNDFLKKLPVNISGTIDFQNNPSREPKIHWQILVNIFHNLNGLQERCVEWDKSEKAKDKMTFLDLDFQEKTNI